MVDGSRSRLPYRPLSKRIRKRNPSKIKSAAMKSVQQFVSDLPAWRREVLCERTLTPEEEQKEQARLQDKGQHAQASCSSLGGLSQSLGQTEPGLRTELSSLSTADEQSQFKPHITKKSLLDFYNKYHPEYATDLKVVQVLKTYDNGALAEALQRKYGAMPTRIAGPAIDSVVSIDSDNLEEDHGLRYIANTRKPGDIKFRAASAVQHFVQSLPLVLR